MIQSVRSAFPWSQVEQHTAVQFEKVQAWVKKVTGLWGNEDGERTRCPRCKGMGLNTPQAAFGWKQAAPSEEACWFCEGVGVMPIVGLNGLLLARSAPVLSTRDFKPRPRLPIRLQLYLGKFPGTKCKTGFYKPSLEFPDLVHDPSKPPSWSEVDPDGFVGSQAALKLARVNSSDRSSLALRDRAGNTPKMASSPRAPSLSRTSGRTSRSWRTPSKPSSGFGYHSQIPTSRSPRTPAGPPSMNSPSRTASAHDASKLAGPKRAPVSPRAGSPRRSGSFRYDSAGRDLSLEPGSPTRSTPLISSPRSGKSPRKERNRVREKAEKEAMERARRIERPLAHRPQQTVTKPADISQDSRWSYKAGEWLKKASSQSHLPSSESSSHGFQYKDIPWINNLVYGKLKDNVKSVINSTKFTTNVKVL